MKQFRPPLRATFVAACAAVALAIAAVAMPAALAATTTMSTGPTGPFATPAPGSDFTITVTANSSVTTAGAQTDLVFDRFNFQINPGTVVFAAPYNAAPYVTVAGTFPQTLADAITEANATGRLKGVTAYCNAPAPCPTTVAAGPNTFFTVQFHTSALYGGRHAEFRPENFEMLDPNGASLPVTLGTYAWTGAASVGGIGEATNLPAAAVHSSGFAAKPMGLWAGLVGALLCLTAFAVYRRLAPRMSR